MGLTGAAKREYQLQWIKARREKWIAENGPCQNCGHDEDLQVDHVIPRAIGGGMRPALIWSRSAEIRNGELAKCQVLCKHCHDAKTKAQMITKKHGSTMYRNGCKCEVCRESQRLKARRLRALAKKRTGKPP